MEQAQAVEIRPDTATKQQSSDQAREAYEQYRDGGLPRRARTRQGKARLVTLDALDLRTAAAKAARVLIDTLTADLGGELSAGEKQLVQRASMIGAIVEDFETKWVAGQPVELNEYLSAVNVQRRVLSTLGLRRRSRDVTPSLSEYLDQIHHQQQTTDDDEEAGDEQA